MIVFGGSHEQDHRQHRDAFVADALGAAGIPLIMVPIFKEYNPQRIRAHIQRAIKGH